MGICYYLNLVHLEIEIEIELKMDHFDLDSLVF